MNAPQPPSVTPLFETHITVSSTADLSLFRKTCADLNVKCIAVELPSGSTRLQPMTGSFVRAPLARALSRAASLAASLADRGFDVVRTKIEQHGALDDVARTPSSYFEYHAKLALPAAHDPLVEIVAAHGGSLSANAANADPLERFLTLRAFGHDRASADERWSALLAAVAARSVATRGRVRELTVFDDNPALDRGWIDAP